MSKAPEIDSASACAYCGMESPGEHFCSACGRIQPVAPGTDYFTFLGLPKKLKLDEPALEKTFYSLSRRFHPDYFMNESERERRASQERSALLNDAYRTLRDPVRRTEYLLSLEGYKEAEKKAPPDLLEEVFELNMQIEELKAAKKMADEDEIGEARKALEEALAGLNEKMAGIDARLTGLFDAWDGLIDARAGEDERKKTLDRMSELLSHRSYVRALVRDIKEEI
ncbi:MAG TPA: Fe-S protein assembly co-chaperone HscB [Blastocatellia bacterium]|jgi:molecular chaperone HscB|nr:Fe-S protein assembly co-chaperone HscB [Blastocatellia bacterium]